MASWSVCERRSEERRKSVLEASWERLGGVLGRLRAYRGRSGASLARVGASWGVLDVSLGRFGGAWLQFAKYTIKLQRKRILCVNGRLEIVLASAFSSLGRSWKRLRSLLERL